MPVCAAESISNSGQRGLTGRLRSKARSKADQGQKLRWFARLEFTVGAAEGCEGGYRFAAFGSSYRELRTR